MFLKIRKTISTVRTVAAALLILGAAVTTGCYEVAMIEEQGSLSATFSISYNGETCEAAGVTEVRAVLDNGLYETVADCIGGEVIFHDVAVGFYELALYGLNEEGIAVVDSLADGPVEVEILAEQNVHVVDPILLTEAPVRLLLRWDLGYGSCQSREIREFEVLAQNSETGQRIMLSTILCGTPGEGTEEYRVVPDNKRELIGQLFNEILVQPISKVNKPFGDDFVVDFDELENPGPGGDLKLSIRCSQTRCSIPGSC